MLTLGKLFGFCYTKKQVDDKVAAAGALKYAREWHVSVDHGNDTTGDGSVSKPFQSFATAMAAMGNTGEVLVVHPGTYSENVSFAELNATIQGSTVGGIVNLSGVWNFTGASSSVRVQGVRFAGNVTHSGAGNLYLNECQLVATFNKSGAGYFEAIDCDIQGTGINVTGAGYTTFVNGKQLGIVVNHASAIVSVMQSLNCAATTISTGAFMASGSTLFALSPTGNAVTNPSTGVLVLDNCVVYNSVGAIGRLASAGAHSISNTRYDTADSSTPVATDMMPVANFAQLKTRALLDAHSVKLTWVLANAYAAGSMVEKDGVLYKANGAIPANTAFAINTSGATWAMVNAPPAAEYGETSVVGNVSIPASNLTPQTVDVATFTLPTAGVWEVTFSARGSVGGDGSWIAAFITDASNVVVANSSAMIGYIDRADNGATTHHQTATQTVRITTSASTQYKLRATASGDTSISYIISDVTNGVSKVVWQKISGLLPVSVVPGEASWSAASTIQSVGWIATTTAPTIGAATENQYRYKQLGVKTWEALLRYRETTAVGTAGSGDYLFTLPNGLQFDASIPGQAPYTGTIGTNNWANLRFATESIGIVTNGTTGGQLFMVPWDITRFRLVVFDTSNGVIPMGSSFYQVGLGSYLLSFTARFKFQAA